MKTRIILTAAVLSMVLWVSVFTYPAAVTGNTEACDSELIIVACANARVQWCGPTIGNGTTDASGFLTVSNLCRGTYTFCVDCDGTIYVATATVSGGPTSSFVTFTNTALVCPCDQ